MIRWGSVIFIVLANACDYMPGKVPLTDLDLLFNLPVAAVPISISGDPVFQDEPLFDAIEGKLGHHAATIIAFPDGELLAAWYSYDGPGELDGSAIYMARKASDQSAWDAPFLHIDRPNGDGNPVLFSEDHSVWLFQAVVPYGWSTAQIEFQRSEDRGHSWSPPVTVEGPLGSNTRYPPLRLRDGRLLLPAYDDLFQRSLFFSSEDGNDWRLESMIETAWDARAIQPSVVELQDGRLLTVMRNTGGERLWVAASDDEGKRWSSARDSGFPNPASAAAITRLASGNLILVFNDSPTERRPLSVAMSLDEGQTWPLRRILADGEETYSYPSVIQGPDGRVHIVYSLSRRRIQHAIINEAWIAGL